MALSSNSMFALVLFSLAVLSVSQGQSFRGRQDQIAVKDVERSLQSLLEAAHSGGTSPVALRLAKIESSVATTYQALPKNEAGRLAPRSVRYIVHNFFAKEHGWQIKGLEPEGMRTNISDIHDAKVLQDKAPALVEALLEAHRSDRGLVLEDVAAMIMLLERLILDESVNLLNAAYYLNLLPADVDVGEREIHEVLRSYLLLFQIGLRGNWTDIDRHRAIKSRMEQKGTSWPVIVEFENDAVNNFEYRTKDVTNPFFVRSFDHDALTEIVDQLAQRYGKWQNEECSRMKSDLMDMDLDKNGRIPLSRFYADSKTRVYKFTESADYLRTIGALEEGHGYAEPRVLLANYIGGPSNCIAASTYYSVCCLNECDDLLNELEASIKAPAASPEQVLNLVKHMTSSSMVYPREVSAALVLKLREIADRNSGVVPLHGRLFAQWLHFAFPHECPFPHITEEASTLTAHHWLGGKAIASPETIAQHINATSGLNATAAVPAHDMHALWGEEEVLPLMAPRRKSRTFEVAGMIVKVALCLVVVRIAWTGYSTLTSMNSQGKKGQTSLPI